LDSVFEEVIILELENGRAIQTEVVDNRDKPLESMPQRLLGASREEWTRKNDT
jgi:hypothetical protein